MKESFGRRWVIRAGMQALVMRWAALVLVFVSIMQMGLAAYRIWAAFSMRDMSLRVMLREGIPTSFHTGVFFLCSGHVPIDCGLALF